MNAIRQVILVITFLSLSFLGLTAVPANSGTQSPSVHWDYEGETGPDHWDRLVLEKWHCKIGDMQSPISITVTEKAKLD